MNQRLRNPLILCLIVCFGLAALCLTQVGLAQSTPSKTPPALLLGTAWYPEQWPESRWEADLALMQKAGVHFVRVGEFAWSRMEPEEGRYDLDWLDRAVTAAAKHDIYTVLGTPTAAPPAWLTQKVSRNAAHQGRRPQGRAWQSRARQLGQSEIPRNGAQDRRADGQALWPQSQCYGLAD